MFVTIWALITLPSSAIAFVILVPRGARGEISRSDLLGCLTAIAIIGGLVSGIYNLYFVSSEKIEGQIIQARGNEVIIESENGREKIFMPRNSNVVISDKVTGNVKRDSLGVQEFLGLTPYMKDVKILEGRQ